jgi:uncharacterized membrane protein YfcA
MFESVTLFDFWIAASLFFGAVLYTSVGHGGASAYIAIMSLFGVPAASIKPTALSLNIFASSYASFQFIRAKLYDLKLVIPLLVGAIPAAFAGGWINLPNTIYKPIVGVMLLYSAYRFLTVRPHVEKPAKPYSKLLAVLVGVVIGFLSGLTGTGGGIFLSPLILFAGWTTVKGASGTAAVFIFFNSVFGLLGNISSVNNLPAALPLYIAFVLGGAFIGTRFGIHYFAHVGVKRLLGVVLLVAGLKLTFNL